MGQQIARAVAAFGQGADQRAAAFQDHRPAKHILLLRAADEALRRAKLDGGNRVCVFQQQGYLYTAVSDDWEPPGLTPQ